MRKKQCLVAGTVAICALSLAITFYARAASSRGSAASDHLCGLRALGGAAARVGVQLTPLKLSRLVPVSDRGCNMFDLRQAALRCGLAAAARSLNWENLIALHSPVLI